MELGKIAYSTPTVLHVLDLATSNVEVYDDHTGAMRTPAWNKAGTHIAYAGPLAVVVIKPGTDNLAPISPLDVKCAFPAWHPDGRSLIYDLQEGGGGSFWHKIEENTVTRIPLSFQAIQADWHPDGTKIVFVGVREGHKHIYTLDLACMEAGDCDGAVKQLTQEAQFNHAPTWSPDGTQIAFERYIDGDNNWSIMVMDADGRNLHRLSSPKVNDHHPTWGPGGRYLAFEREEEALGGNIYMMFSDGSNVTQLTTEGGREPAWWLPPEV